MTTIRDFLARDLSKKIEEIIKVDQADEQSVYDEITDYIATDRIKDQYRELLKAIAEGPREQTESVGVWISGFFGSGKSSFAKNLGYVLADRNVLGKKASTLFKDQIKDQRIGELVDLINASIPTEVIMFDVSVDRAVKRATERIAEIMYTVLLRELDYAQDYDITELEIELEGEGRLDEFTARCRQMFVQEWRKARTGAQKISRASAILHAMDPSTYATADSWAQSLHGKSADITVGKFVERTFELMARRRPGKGLVFIIDEVGQYVARSAEKIEDLRAVVEQFGKTSKNYLKQKKAVAPVWVIVTSQEKLDEVVAAIDSKRVELAKLQDRFKHRVDLAPADIREVATKRVLAKKKEAVPTLQQLFDSSQGQLNAACRLERTQRRSEVTRDDFTQFYPYLPHFIELSIYIMSGIRLQPGAPRHYGGSNRTIIKQAYEMLVSDRTAMADKPVGTLVTLDKIFELVEGNLSSEKQKDISDITERFRDDHEDEGASARVAKAISLLEFIPDIPRTEANIAACLIDRVGQPSPLPEVQSALRKLEASQFVRNTEQGWKLQTAQEKNWDTERRAIEPRPKDRNEITRDVLRGIFDEPQLKKYRYRDLRTFEVGIIVDSIRAGGEGDITLSVFTAEDAAGFAGRVEETRAESRETSHKNDIYWVFALTPEIDDLEANLYASRQMIAKYRQLSAQNRITKDEQASLSTEEHEVNRLQSRLRDKMLEALENGQGIFRGVSKDAAALGKNASEIFKRLFDFAFPDLYPKLEMGYRPLKGNEVEEFLKAANLNALTPVFYEGENGLGLVTKEGSKFVPNPAAPVAKEVLDYIKREHSYGNKVTGKSLEEHFQGIGYGWERDMLRLMIAVLLRAGSVEVTYQGRRFRNYQDPQSRTPLVTNLAFKAASFSPRETIDLRTLTSAVKHLEELTGDEVDIEEGAIATAFKKLADEELKLLLAVIATVQANSLPGLEALEDYGSTLSGVQASASDDCVRMLAGEGNTLREMRDRVRQIRDAVVPEGLTALRQARIAVGPMRTTLAASAASDEVISQKANDLQSLVVSPSFYEELDRIKRLTRDIIVAYRDLYAAAHRSRSEIFSKAIDEVKGRAEWGLLPADMHASVLTPLSSRLCAPPEEDVVLSDALTECVRCAASISQMESDVAAASSLKSGVLTRVQELIEPDDNSDGVRVERVRLAEFFIMPLDSDSSIDEALNRLSDYLHKLVAEGVRVVVE